MYFDLISHIFNYNINERFKKYSDQTDFFVLRYRLRLLKAILRCQQNFEKKEKPKKIDN